MMNAHNRGLVVWSHNLRKLRHLFSEYVSCDSFCNGKEKINRGSLHMYETVNGLELYNNTEE
jgi:hypothetical protein